MIIFKNIFSFILTFYAYDWIIGGGFQTVFLIVASIQMGICVLTIPLCKPYLLSPSLLPPSAAVGKKISDALTSYCFSSFQMSLGSASGRFMLETTYWP